jgi:hypothetical protein
MLWGARRTFTVDPELKTPIADPKCPKWLLSVRWAPAVTKSVFIGRKWLSLYVPVHVLAVVLLPILAKCGENA